ncbi:MAG: hypothetical protein JW828_09550 [Sedimentisphaerales bacterium]|nr:hypothetical protein [Sedimentisphaerales bacterium]
MCFKSKKGNVVRLSLLVAFSAAFAYIESSVVVYLRALFYPDGFAFPIADFTSMEGALRFLLTEIGREAATVVLIFTGAGLMAGSFRRRLAYFLIIFAVWDIFYYIWLKVLLDWPASLLDWDILFLIPTVWAGPVLAPLLTSAVMLWVAALLLRDKTLVIPGARWIGIAACIAGIVICFCLPGPYVTKPEFASYFSWPIFLTLHVAIVVLLCRSVES